METNIPEEVIIEILSRLPVKSLCMFKIVCKPWHSLISSKFFVEKHTQNQMITYYGNKCDIMRDDHRWEVRSCDIIRDVHRWEVPETFIPKSFKTNVKTCKKIRGKLRRKYIPCYYRKAIEINDRVRYSNCLLIDGRLHWRYESGNFVASLFKDYGNKKFQAFKNEDKVVNCPFFDCGGHFSRIIGSCNGVVCIYDRNEIALWNPTIGDLKVVPSSRLKPPRLYLRRCGEVGFGFDSCTNDYKIVQILFQLCNNHPFVPHQVEIYSLSTNSWRKFRHTSIPARFRYHLESYYGSMVHKNEIFCWSALSKRKPDEDVILWVDMRDEVFRTTPFPQHSLLKYSKTKLKMCPLHDSISLIFYCDKTIEIWSIKDLHDKDSWTKLLSICPLSQLVRPLGFWNNGEFMILQNDSNELLLYNFRTRKLVTTGIENGRFCDLTSCIETLVPVNGYCMYEGFLFCH